MLTDRAIVRVEYASQFTYVSAGSMLFGLWFPPHVLCTLLCPFWLVYTPCGQIFTVRFTDTSTGVGTLVGRESNERLNRHNWFNVIFAAVYDVLLVFSWCKYIACIYVNMFA